MALVASILPNTAFSGSLAETTNHNVSYNASEPDVAIPSDILEVMEEQEEALKSYQLMMTSFSKDDYGQPIYPEEYAGAYIDSGNLVIQLTDISDEMISKYSTLCGESAVIKFQEAKYTLNYLNSLENYAWDMLEEGYDVVGFGVCEKQNVYQIDIQSDPVMQIANEYVRANAISNLPISFIYYGEETCKPQGGRGPFK